MFWKIGITKSNNLRLFLLVTALLSALLLPAIPLHPSLPSIRFEELILFIAFGLNILWLIWVKILSKNPEKKPTLTGFKDKHFKTVYILFGLLFLSYFLSNLYGVYIRGMGYFGLRDVMELVTYFKYFLLLTLTMSVEIGKSEFDYLSKVFLAGLVFLIVFGWLQHLNPLGINTWLTPYFNQVHWEHLITSYPVRVLGTFDNPNYFGIFTVISLSYLTTYYFFGSRKGKFPWPLFILIGFMIKLEIFTISRTALFSMALLFTIICIAAFFYHRYKKEVLKKIVALFLLTMLLFFTASGDFFYRLNEGLDFSTSTSFTGHVERWNEAMDTYWGSPVLGWGTQKYVMTTKVDNEFVLFSRRYGLVGLAVYLAFFLTPFIKGLKGLRRKRGSFNSENNYRALVIVSYCAVLPSVFVFAMMAGIFYNLKVMTIFIIAMGLVYNSLRTFESHSLREG